MDWWTTTTTYDRCAPEFAARWFDFHLDRAFSALAQRVPPGSWVLDVGCGPGRDVRRLMDMGYRATGVDLSAGMLREARRRVPGDFAQMDMRRLGFADASFDAIWACASLIHLPREDAPSTLAEFHRVLGTGTLFLGVQEGTGEAWVDVEGWGPRYYVYYSEAEVRRLLAQAGFEVVELWTNPGQEGQHPWINCLAQTRG